MEKESNISEIEAEAKRQVEFIRSFGIDPEEFVFAMSMEMLFVDMADSYISHVKSLVKNAPSFHHYEKQTIKNIKDKLADFALRMSKSLGNRMSKEQQVRVQEGFGDKSDFVRECCCLLVKINEEDRIKVLSTLKMFVK